MASSVLHIFVDKNTPLVTVCIDWYCVQLRQNPRERNARSVTYYLMQCSTKGRAFVCCSPAYRGIPIQIEVNELAGTHHRNCGFEPREAGV